jgi:hypothetical protein
MCTPFDWSIYAAEIAHSLKALFVEEMNDDPSLPKSERDANSDTSEGITLMNTRSKGGGLVVRRLKWRPPLVAAIL